MLGRRAQGSSGTLRTPGELAPGRKLRQSGRWVLPTALSFILDRAGERSWKSVRELEAHWLVSKVLFLSYIHK